MDWFNREVQSIENEAKHFIDESFKSLRSAEGAFDMLLNFKHIRYFSYAHVKGKMDDGTKDSMHTTKSQNPNQAPTGSKLLVSLIASLWLADPGRPSTPK